jgi:hypothetical protein
MAIMLSAKTKVMIGDLHVKNLTSVPAFNETKATLEVTSLDNEARVYISGLKEPAESLEFSGYYEAAEFKKLRDLAEQGGQQDVSIELPDGLVISFKGEISVGLGEIAVGEAPTFTLAITPGTEFEFDFSACEGIQ